MTTADDHWPETLQRVVAAMEFELTDEKIGADTTKPSFMMRVVTHADFAALPALVTTAIHAGFEIDRRIAGAGRAYDAQARKVRQALAEALNREVVAGGSSPFVTGYATAYRMELARVLWAAISDAPARRLQELARTRLV
ncbi:hypothetical protein [Caulobacter sp. RL271]|jgi:hypothetical protein|uniref:Uncharacterized protein n=1 Tax=Caulobacter segnis TaxID=88688 RepID=A0ABY4ZZP0_9CAUL|nr:hypothetical protein [Caulobacter segnis]USQ98135.1 hypothetical protein MZV50_11575 [Caulobacter segnis]